MLRNKSELISSRKTEDFFSRMSLQPIQNHQSDSQFDHPPAAVSMENIIRIKETKKQQAHLNKQNRKLKSLLNSMLSDCLKERQNNIHLIDPKTDITSLSDLKTLNRRASISYSQTKKHSHLNSSQRQSKSSMRFSKIRSGSLINSSQIDGEVEVNVSRNRSSDLRSIPNLFQELKKPKIINLIQTNITDSDKGSPFAESHRKKPTAKHYSGSINLQNILSSGPAKSQPHKNSREEINFISPKAKENYTGTNHFFNKFNMEMNDLSKGVNSNILQLSQMSKDNLLERIVQRKQESEHLHHLLRSPTKRSEKPASSRGLIGNNNSISANSEDVPIPEYNISSQKYTRNNSLEEIEKIRKEESRKIAKINQVCDSLSSEEEIIFLNKNHESTFIVDPDSYFKTIWDFTILIITLYSILFSPIYLAFIIIENPIVTALEVGMDIIFIFDMVLNFFTPYYDAEEELVKNLTLIASNYFFGFFWADLVASIPGSLIMIIINSISSSSIANHKLSSLNKATRLTKIYRMVRFTKIFKMYKISDENAFKKSLIKLPLIEELNISSSMQRLSKLFVSFLVASHMITCIWIFVGSQDNPNWMTKAHLEDVSNVELYLHSFYFQWTTIFTIGYGDITSSHTLERIYNCVLMFIGVLIYSFTVSSLGNLVMSYDNLTKKYYDNIELLDEIKWKYKVPDEFCDRVSKYLNYNFKFNKNQKYAFINELPPKLKNNLLLNMYEDIIQSFHFFADCTQEFTAKVVFCLRPARSYAKELLVYEGEYLEEVYFVRRGVASVNLGARYRDLKVMEIRKNEHFGDILALSNQKSPINLKVFSRSIDLLMIRKQDLLEITAEFPELFEEIFLVSAYNHSAMMERVEKKKKYFEDKMANKELNSFESLNSDDYSSFADYIRSQKTIKYDDFSRTIANNTITKELKNDTVFASTKINNKTTIPEKLIWNEPMSKKPSVLGQASDNSNTFVTNILKEPIPINIESQIKNETFTINELTKNASSGRTYNFNLYIQNNNYITSPVATEPIKEEQIVKEKEGAPPLLDLSSEGESPILLNIQEEKKGLDTIIEEKTIHKAAREDSGAIEDKFEMSKHLSSEMPPTKQMNSLYSGKKKNNTDDKALTSPVFRKINTVDDLKSISPNTEMLTNTTKQIRNKRASVVLKGLPSRHNSKYLQDTQLGSKKVIAKGQEQYRNSSILVSGINSIILENVEVEKNPNKFFANEVRSLVNRELSRQMEEQSKKLLLVFAKLFKQQNNKEENK